MSELQRQVISLDVELRLRILQLEACHAVGENPEYIQVKINDLRVAMLFHAGLQDEWTWQPLSERGGINHDTT